MQPLHVEDMSNDSTWDYDKITGSDRGVLRALVAHSPLFILELFSGSGRLTSAISSQGLAVLHPFEIYQGWEFALTRPSTQALVLDLINKGLGW